MAKGKSGNNKCQSYLNNRTRIKNKTRKLEKRLKHSSMSQDKKDKIIKNCRIGRKAEGFQIESFKHNKPKNVDNGVKS
jgi:hypothetical protein